ncbi:hypothetical protein [Luteimonas suaedae]|uniref:hypothetical protein n=1 Tax=Luteimonas suaedae TaxID=2605430 RepID=UPI0011EC73D7|nr:hypothetical protein [Luteimonas suaedae]
MSNQPFCGWGKDECRQSTIGHYPKRSLQARVTMGDQLLTMNVEAVGYARRDPAMGRASACGSHQMIVTSRMSERISRVVGEVVMMLSSAGRSRMTRRNMRFRQERAS